MVHFRQRGAVTAAPLPSASLPRPSSYRINRRLRAADLRASRHHGPGRRWQAHSAGQGYRSPPGLPRPQTPVGFPRGSVIVRHSPGHGHSHSHSHGEGPSDSGGGCCSHSHAHSRNKVLSRVFHATGLQAVSDMLKSSRWPYALAVAALLGAVALPYVAPTAAAASQALIGVVYLIAGLPSFMDAAHDVASLTMNTHVLTMMAVMCLVPLGHAIEGALLLVLFNLSHELEDALTVKARGNLETLLDSAPTKVTVVQLGPDGSPDFSSEEECLVNQIGLGALIVARAGQEVALDGEVVFGEAMYSAEHISGESIPLHCGPGDLLPAGALNNDGLLVIRVTATLENSTPARMARLAQDAQANKPRVQTLVESVLATYSKFVLYGTLAVAVLLPLLAGVPLFGGPGGSPGALYRAAGFLTTAAPCAILMAPLVYVSAIAAAAQRGILLKGASAIDTLAKCRVVALDKTGTLTTGLLTCTSVLPVFHHPEGSGMDSLDTEDSETEAIAIAVALSRGSMHPVSNAITRGFGEEAEQLQGVQLQGYTSLPGRGVTSECTLEGRDSRQVLFGSKAFVVSHLTEVGHLEGAKLVGAEGSEGGEVVSFLVQQQAGALAVHAFRFRDQIHGKSRASVAALRDHLGGRGQVAMLSGDNRRSAGWMASQLGLSPDEVKADLQPEDKLLIVGELRRSNGGSVLMVGDGNNDAAALAGADVGLAMAATPSTMAAAAADGVILSGKGSGVSALPFLLSLSAFTRRVVLQNFFLAGLAIAGTTLPLVAGLLPLWMGVAIHEGSTLLVAINSLRPLLHRGPELQTTTTLSPATRPSPLSTAANGHTAHSAGTCSPVAATAVQSEGRPSFM